MNNEQDQPALRTILYKPNGVDSSEYVVVQQPDLPEDEVELKEEPEFNYQEVPGTSTSSPLSGRGGTQAHASSKDATSEAKDPLKHIYEEKENEMPLIRYMRAYVSKGDERLLKLKQDHGHKSMAYRRELETRRKELGFFNFVTKTIGYLGGKFVNPEFNDEELSGRDKVKGVKERNDEERAEIRGNMKVLSEMMREMPEHRDCIIRDLFNLCVENYIKMSQKERECWEPKILKKKENESKQTSAPAPRIILKARRSVGPQNVAPGSSDASATSSELHPSR